MSSPLAYAELMAAIASLIASSGGIRVAIERVKSELVSSEIEGGASDEAVQALRLAELNLADMLHAAEHLGDVVLDARRADELLSGGRPSSPGKTFIDSGVVGPVVEFGSVSPSKREATGAVDHIDVSIYLDTDDPRVLAAVRTAIEELLNTKPDWGEIESGSLYQRGKVWFTSKKTKEEVSRRLAKVETALEAVHLQSPQSQANLANAQAIASLTAAHKEAPNAVFKLDSLLYVKRTDVTGEEYVVARTLTAQEQIQFEMRRQDLIKDVDAALQFLEATDYVQIEPPDLPAGESPSSQDGT